MGIISRISRERGVTVLVVTHDVNLASALAGQVVAMSGGRVVCAGTPDEICAPESLEAIYGTSFRRYIADIGGGEALLPAGRERVV
jgi:iron complex transport system ATP-binding protein